MREDGQAGQAMPDARDRGILTLNRRHFVHLHNSGANHLGIIVCSFDPDFEAQSRHIHLAISDGEPGRCLIRVNRPG